MSNSDDKTINGSTKNTKLKEEKPLWKYLKTELTRGYLLDQDEQKYSAKRDKVYTFLSLPLSLERFMVYGFFHCADAFLYICTFLPIRILIALYQLVSKPSLLFFHRPNKIMTPAQMIDICKGIVIVSCCLILTLIDTSMVYHIIRGQAVIKLYIFFNMLEIADRLLSSVGQDILDALFWTATETKKTNKKNFGVLTHLILAIIYVFCHALLVLCQTTTLNVAFNSHNKSLLTIMMSNNFIELKGNVFKKFDKNNLFLMSCSDIRERFNYFILLLMVCIRNMAEFDWDLDQLNELMPMFAVIFFSEFFIDWIKHGFIIKFNDISPQVYRDYTLSLAYDMAKTKQKHALTDHSDLLSRRMGFIPLPLVCLLFRICSQSMKLPNFISIINIFLAFLCLMSIKILNGIILLAISYEYINEHRKKIVENKIQIIASINTTNNSNNINKNIGNSKKKSISFDNLEDDNDNEMQDFDIQDCETLKYQSAFET